MKRVITSVNAVWVVDQKSHDRIHFLKRVALTYGGGGESGRGSAGSPVSPVGQGGAYTLARMRRSA